MRVAQDQVGIIHFIVGALVPREAGLHNESEMNTLSFAAEITK